MPASSPQNITYTPIINERPPRIVSRVGPIYLVLFDIKFGKVVMYKIASGPYLEYEDDANRRTDQLRECDNRFTCSRTFDTKKTNL